MYAPRACLCVVMQYTMSVCTVGSRPNACHKRFVFSQAYQILRHGGIAEENIVVMMADDIATSPANPHPNQIFNRPGGADVYDGVPVVSQLCCYTYGHHQIVLVL